MVSALICSFFLNDCGLGHLPTTSEQKTTLLAAATRNFAEKTAEEFTGELLPDGSIRLTWPRDPSAVSYLVLSKGKVKARVPATVLSAVIAAKGKSASNGKFAIESVDASNVRSKWVSDPAISIAVEEAPPTGEAQPVEETPPAEETPPVEETPPSEETPPEEETPPAEETPPVEEIPPTEETPPVEENPPAEVINLAPVITDTSYNCDPVVESVAFTVGQTDHFTLSVNDESPLTLTYSFDISKEGIVAVEVDSNGVFALTALQAGDAFLWLSAEDNKGLVDEYELRVVVQ